MSYLTKEKIEERFKKLESEKTDMMAVYAGAMQDCQYWLSELAKTSESKGTAE
jgi:hypothetical protein